MKKITSLLVLIVLTITVNAQYNMYMGLESGMTEMEFRSHCRNDSRFIESASPKVFIVEIYSREYAIFGTFNDSDELYAIILLCNDKYSYLKYDANISRVGLEVYELISNKYGDPYFDEIPEWTEIPDDGLKSMCKWRHEDNIEIYLDVVHYPISDDYGTSIIIMDTEFADDVVAKTGGF